MRFLPFILLFVSTTLGSCKKVKYDDIGVIKGYDLSMCACCGGFFIQIKDSTYIIRSAPLNSGVDLYKTSLPIKVELNWSVTNSCHHAIITATEMRRVN